MRWELAGHRFSVTRLVRTLDGKGGRRPVRGVLCGGLGLVLARPAPPNADSHPCTSHPWGTRVILILGVGGISRNSKQTSRKFSFSDLNQFSVVGTR